MCAVIRVLGSSPRVGKPHDQEARNLLYTGITRGKRLGVLVGQRRALAIAVRNQGGRKRGSRLREWLLVTTTRDSADPRDEHAIRSVNARQGRAGRLN
jgi:hypothetical protein